MSSDAARAWQRVITALCTHDTQSIDVRGIAREIDVDEALVGRWARAEGAPSAVNERKLAGVAPRRSTVGEAITLGLNIQRGSGIWAHSTPSRRRR